MKILKKMAAAAAVITFLMGLTVMPAAAKEPYDYTITLHAGNKGTVSGRDNVRLTASYDNIISFDLSQVQVTDERYYVKGIRLAGRDNNTVSATTFRVTGDADYVVAYGIKGNLVSYTVKYQDASGKQLVPDRVFYGNVGDKPIVAYQYVENYVPRALALTKTLSANAAENVFTFVYAPGDAGTITVRGDDTTMWSRLWCRERPLSQGPPAGGSPRREAMEPQPEKLQGQLKTTVRQGQIPPEPMGQTMPGKRSGRIIW